MYLTPAVVLGVVLDVLVLPLMLLARLCELVLGVPLDNVIPHDKRLPPVLLVHGPGVGSSTWSFIPAWLALRKHYDVYTVRLGYRRHVSYATMARIVADRVFAVRLFTGRARVNIVGHHAGGLVAAAAAMMVPTSVASVVTVGSPWQGVGRRAGVMYKLWGPRHCDLLAGSEFLRCLSSAPGTVPMMCVCMLGDAWVPYRLALPAADAAAHDGLILKNVGHMSAIASLSTWACVASWLQCRALPTRTMYT
jgi:hypothetical protein